MRIKNNVMKTPFQKGLTLILLAALLTGNISCGNTNDGSNVPTSDSQTDTEAPEKPYLSELDFDGETVSIFATDYENTKAFENTFVSEATGDVVNDALYRKNQSVSENLNVTLQFIEHDFIYNTRDAMYDAIRKSVMSDSNPYDIVLVPTYFTSTLVAEGLLCDLGGLPHIDFTKEWWSHEFIEAAEIDGKIYMAAGDGVLPYITGLFAVAYNTDMAKEYVGENLFDVVRSGKWTIDRLNTYAKNVYRDLNGDSASDENDQFGLEVLNGNFIIPFLAASEVTAFRKSGDSYEYVYGNERAVALYDKLFQIIHDDKITYLVTKDVSGDIRTGSAFAEGRSLFTLINLIDTAAFRDAKFTFSVLPYPKADESQQSYHTFASNGVVTIGVPVTGEGSETVGAVLEAMAYYGFQYTTPAYFDIALKIKYTEGGDTAEMLDLIKSSATTPIGDMFAAAIGAPSDKFKNMIYNAANEGVWASTAASEKTSYVSKMDVFLENLRTAK